MRDFVVQDGERRAYLCPWDGNDLIEYGDKYSAMSEFVDPAFNREFQTIMKTLKAQSKKGPRLHKERCAK